MDKFSDEWFTLNPTPEDGRGIFLAIDPATMQGDSRSVVVVGYDKVARVAMVDFVEHKESE